MRSVITSPLQLVYVAVLTLFAMSSTANAACMNRGDLDSQIGRASCRERV